MQPHRHGGDLAEVMADVLAGVAVTSGRAARERALVIDQLDRKAIELGLEHKRDRALISIADAALQMLNERGDLVAILRRLQAQHCCAVLALIERADRLGTNALRRRVLALQ